ncbi:Hypothetical protein PHPALM_4623 [Phytophthora palmivora]|uniref:Uncharacterized protein n=1 Tax=Phytophthora palmivora TaxID=4796 RepID=A0A2P4YJJ7_9STRA|nr:Hypothetical protein PHPALM_4623 [Phytophthora palmivora]
MDQAQCPSPTTTDVFETETTKPAKRPRKKNKRPAKRFMWQEDLHLHFVAAIFDLGLKNASPKLLLPLMNKSDPSSGLTTEHIKSHLQKYRINYERSRREFRAICNKEIKRDRKRRRQKERRSSTFVVHGRGCSDSTTSQNATDSGSGYEDTIGSANVAKNDPHMRPIVSSSERDGVAASVATSRYPIDFLPGQQTSSVAVLDSSSMPELTDAQWRAFSMLMSRPLADTSSYGSLSIQVPQEIQFGQAQVEEELQQMHQAMQEQMSFHRQMLTRKVELSGGLDPRSDVENCEYSGYNRPSVLESAPSTFQQVWTSNQQIHQRQMASHRLQQQQLDTMEGVPQQFLQTIPDGSGSVSQTLSCDSLPTLIDRPLDAVESKNGNIGEDLHRWDPFNVGLEDDELFDFLKA